MARQADLPLMSTSKLHINSILNNFLSNCGLDKDLYLSKISLSALKGGQSSASIYQFEINGSRFVLRTPPAGAHPLTKAHQSLLARQAGELGIGPKTHYIDPEFNGIILDYIPGQEAKAQDFQNPLLIDKMANTLRTLHQAKRPFPIAVSPFTRFNDFLQKNPCQSNALKKIKLCMDEIEKTLRFYPVPPSPTHLDLHLSNIILKDKEEIYLIDWVNGGIADPFFDLATFSYFAELNETQIEIFLNSYFQRVPSEIEKARFNIIFPIRIMVIAASFFASGSNNRKSCETYTEKSIYLIETEIFERSLKQLQNIALLVN